MSLSNKLNKLERQCEAQARTSSRLEDDLVELMTTQDATQAQVNELVVQMRDIRGAVATRPLSARGPTDVHPAGLTEAETTELVKSIIASLTSRPLSAAARSLPQVRKEVPVPRTSPPPRLAGTSHSQRRGPSCETPAPDSPSEELASERSSSPVASQVMKTVSSAMTDSDRSASPVTSESFLKYTDGLVANTVGGPLESDGDDESNDGIGSVSGTMEGRVVKELQERVQFCEASYRVLRQQFDVLVDALRGMTSFIDVQRGRGKGGEFSLMNILEEMSPKSTATTLMNDDTHSRSLPTTSAGQDAHNSEDWTTQRLADNLGTVVGVLVGLSNTAQSIHVEQPAKVKVVHRGAEALGAENSVSSTQADVLSSRRESDGTTNMYLPGPPLVVPSHVHEDEAVSEMGSVSYVDEAITEKVQNLDKRMNATERGIVETNVKLQGALKSIISLSAAVNKRKGSSTPTSIGASPRQYDREEITNLLSRVWQIEKMLGGHVGKVSFDGRGSDVSMQASNAATDDYVDSTVSIVPGIPALHGGGDIEYADEQDERDDEAVILPSEGNVQVVHLDAQMLEMTERMSQLDDQLQDLRLYMTQSVAYAAENDLQQLSQRLTAEINSTKQQIAKNADSAATMTAQVRGDTLDRVELLHRFENIHLQLEHLRGALDHYAAREYVENAVNSLMQQTRTIKGCMVDKLMLNDRLRFKAEKIELDK